MSKTTYLRRKAEGLCTVCGGEIEADRKGRATCFKCKEKNRQDKLADKEFRRKLGLCPRCGKNKLYGDERNCLECRVVNAKYDTRDRKSREYRDLQNATMKRLRAQRKEQGICTTCGKNNTDGVHSNCEYCRAKKRIYNIDYRRLNRPPKTQREIYDEQGLCIYCGKPRKDGYKLCNEHYQIVWDSVHSDNTVKGRQITKSRWF